MSQATSLVRIVVLLCLILAAAQALPGKPGDPLPGLTASEALEFTLGLDVFTQTATIEDGLGPSYNGTSCSVCHNVPAIGGTSLIIETRAAYRDASGAFRALNQAGDTLVHHFSLAPHACQPSIPDDANVVAHRISIPAFGAGLIEAIADETLRALEDPFDRNRDGVRGRAAVVTDLAGGGQRVGRFGWKAQHATLRAFAADAELNEMGMTNDLLPKEHSFGISDEQMRRCDTIPDPEDHATPDIPSAVDHFVNFMKLLAPVARGAIDDDVRDGERIFAAIGCTACHVPSLTTGPNANPLFNRRPVPLFSDLLLHDIGTGDGIPQAAAGAEEIRTPALWGLRVRRPFLHDGSAATIEDAIGRHEREAELAARGFRQLPPSDQMRLLAFLRSL